MRKRFLLLFIFSLMTPAAALAYGDECEGVSGSGCIDGVGCDCEWCFEGFCLGYVCNEPMAVGIICHDPPNGN